MIRQTLVVLAAAFVAQTTAFAAPSYTASLAGPATAEKLVSSDRQWSCEGATCFAGGEATSPARHICSRLSKAAGPLTGFAVKGRAFSVEQVAACNAQAGHNLTQAAAQ